jgi:hypothetical protein
VINFGSLIKRIILRYEEVAWWGLGLGLLIALPFVPDNAAVIGRDWITIYRPAVISERYLSEGLIANPSYILFLFKAIALLPPVVGYQAIILISVLSFRLISQLSGINKWLIFPSFPSLWMLVYGQIDALTALGVALGWWAIRNKRPYWQGMATLLLFIKPHVGGLLAIYYLVWQRDRRAFVISGSVFAASMLWFGFEWPIDYVNSLIRETINGANSSGFNSLANAFNNIGLFPIGLTFFIFLFLPAPREKRILAVISASLLASPYAGNYSMLATMAVQLPL